MDMMTRKEWEAAITKGGLPLYNTYEDYVDFIERFPRLLEDIEFGRLSEEFYEELKVIIEEGRKDAKRFSADMIDFRAKWFPPYSKFTKWTDLEAKKERERVEAIGLTDDEMQSVLLQHIGSLVDMSRVTTKYNATNGETTLNLQVMWNYVPEAITLVLKNPEEGVYVSHARRFAKIAGYVGTQEMMFRIGTEIAIAIFNRTTPKQRVESFSLIRVREEMMHIGYAVPLHFGLDHWANGKNAVELGMGRWRTAKKIKN